MASPRSEAGGAESDDADGRSDSRPQRGIQSIEVGGQLLRALVQQGRPMALKDLAREAGMVPGKAHPYLVSFAKLGLIEQQPASGHYGLGPLALQLGLIGLQQFDPLRLASERMAGLAMESGHTVALAVWGNRGPAIVRVEYAPSPVHVAMRHGMVMSLRGTATGKVFAAYLPRATVTAALAAEAAWAQATERHRSEQGPAALPATPGRPSPGLDAAFEQELQRVRASGLGAVVDEAVVGVSALAAPVFDAQGRIVLALTLVGPSATFDAGTEGALGQQLKRCADELTLRTGGQAPA